MSRGLEGSVWLVCDCSSCLLLLVVGPCMGCKTYILYRVSGSFLSNFYGWTSATDPCLWSHFLVDGHAWLTLEVVGCWATTACIQPGPSWKSSPCLVSTLCYITWLTLWQCQGNWFWWNWSGRRSIANGWGAFWFASATVPCCWWMSSLV